jgi:hypothetical protein
MRKIWMTLAVVAAASCAHGGSSKATVSDADMGRLEPGQMGPIDNARQFAMSAKDELARAQLRQQQSQHESDLAKADQQAAEAAQKRADTQNKVANDSREPAQLEAARKLTEQAKLHKQAADAHMDYAKKIADARKTAVEAAQKQVELGNARLEYAKLQSLQAASVPAASKYDASKFQGQVNNAQKAFDDSLKKAREQESQATAAMQKWQDVQRQMQATTGTVPTG